MKFLQKPIYGGVCVLLQEGGGLVGFYNNLLNKEWAEMCGAAYTLATVT